MPIPEYELQSSAITDFAGSNRFDSDYKLSTYYDDLSDDTLYRLSPEYTTKLQTWRDTSERKSGETQFKAYRPYKRFMKSLKGTEFDPVYQQFMDEYRYNKKAVIRPFNYYYDVYSDNHDLEKYQRFDRMVSEFRNKHENKFNRVPQWNPRNGWNQWAEEHPFDESTPENYKRTLAVGTLEKPLNAIDHVTNLYGTARARRGIRRTDRHAARELGVPFKNFKSFSPINKIDIIEDSPYDKAVFDMDGENSVLISGPSKASESKYNINNRTITLGTSEDWIDGTRFTPEEAAAHELAHTRRAFNFFDADDNKRVYRENLIPEKYRQWLTPTISEEQRANLGETGTAHDLSLSENYSDLMGLRTLSHFEGIKPKWRNFYTKRDVQKMRAQLGNTNRYLQYHQDDKYVRKALNRIWSKGGKLI